MPIVVQGPLGLLRLSLSLQLDFSRELLLLKFTDRDCTFKNALGGRLGLLIQQYVSSICISLIILVNQRGQELLFQYNYILPTMVVLLSLLYQDLVFIINKGPSLLKPPIANKKIMAAYIIEQEPYRDLLTVHNQVRLKELFNYIYLLIVIARYSNSLSFNLIELWSQLLLNNQQQLMVYKGLSACTKVEQAYHIKSYAAQRDPVQRYKGCAS